MFVFFKQKTAYELRISDWSSDVCSSDLAECGARLERIRHRWTTIAGLNPIEPDQPFRVMTLRILRFGEVVADEVVERRNAGRIRMSPGDALHRGKPREGKKVAEGIDRKSTRLNSSH